MSRFDHVPDAPAKQTAAAAPRPDRPEPVDQADIVAVCDRCGAGYTAPTPTHCTHPGCQRTGPAMRLGKG